MLTGQKATNGTHRGVRIIKNRSSGKKDTLRWRDPVTGREKNKRLAGRTAAQMREAAKQKLDEITRIQAQIEDETYLPAQTDLITAYTTDPEVTRGTLQSRDVASRFLRRLEEANGITAPEARRSHLKQLREWIIDTDLKTSTKNLRLSQLRAFFNQFADACPHLSADVVKKELKDLKDREQTQHGTHLTSTQLQDLLSKSLEANAEHAAFFALCFLCGCRPSEIIALNKRTDDTYSIFIDEPGRPPQLEVRAKKTVQLRRIGFDVAPIAVDLLRALQNKKGDGFWFARTTQESRVGLQDYTPQKTFGEKLRKELGWTFKLKDLRASSAAYISHLQVNPALVVDRMGHTQGVSQESYLEGVNTLQVKDGAKTLEDAAQITESVQHIIDRLCCAD